MRGSDVALFLALTVGFFVLTAPVWERRRDDRPGARSSRRRLTVFWPGVVATALGGVAFFVSLGLRAFARSELGIEDPERGAIDVVAVAFSLLVIAPFDESLRVAAVVYPLRSRGLKRPYDGMRLAIGAAVGFATLEAARRLWGAPIGGLLAARVALDSIAHVSLSSLWGFAVARQRRRTVGGPGFGRTFLAAVVFGGIATHLLLVRGPIATWAAVPLVLSGVLTSLVARRDLLRITEQPKKKRRFSQILRVNAPSIEELERALLRRPDRPVMLRWIVFGAFVTIGVLLTMVAGSVLLGHRTGVDFAAVDEAASFDQSAAPLVLLGTAILCAFPFSGYLVARASAAKSVLEPALSASVAIVSLMVLLGLAAPIAVVFGLALAPVAFALACTGAWVGLER
ncbi:MAG: PrsW family intramembrane metalloprotease [Polyangiaceae bacterium]|nr:PrsW family intramembrane metalloprotease [Polyangiaceae bacterium]